ncbi:MAG: signal peptidase II [Firmicutes bacterium]|nr:signal peptidase II [Bacillota bacterium]MBQ2270294.1 signal peptidase II [Bacillota bacterium]
MAILALIGLDWLTKYWIQTSMALNDTIPVIDGIFHITYIHNYGAAFSILQGKQSFLLIVTGIAMTAILAYMVIGQIKKKAASMELWSLALILAGGIGNFIDRVRFGYVVDFFDFRIWPIFNVADIAVCCGCGLLVFYVLIWEPRMQKKAKEA